MDPTELRIRSEPIKLIESDIDCDRIVAHAQAVGNWNQCELAGPARRNSREIKIADPELDKLIFESVKKVLIEYMNSNPGAMVTHDEGYIVHQYGVGEEFKLHYDQMMNYPYRVVSLVIYLNDDFEGGETEFPTIPYKQFPKKGHALLFPSNYVYPHRSNPITKGTKYSLVTWFNLRGSN